MFGKRKNRDDKQDWKNPAQRAGSPQSGAPQGRREAGGEALGPPSKPDASAVLNRQPAPPIRPEQLQRNAGAGQPQTQPQPQAQAQAQAQAEPTPADDAESDTGRKLIVGREIALAGEIRSCEKLVVEGTVEASLSDSQALEVAQSGIFEGSAVIDVADIAGRFEGDLTVRERLSLRSTGYVKGTIRYRELEIESGGRIGGTLIELGIDDEAESLTATVSEWQSGGKESAGKNKKAADDKRSDDPSPAGEAAEGKTAKGDDEGLFAGAETSGEANAKLRNGQGRGVSSSASSRSEAGKSDPASGGETPPRG